VLRFVVFADVATVAGIALTAAVCGWVLGYAHRSLIGWGIRRNPLRLAVRAYRELFKDIAYLLETGRLRPGRLARFLTQLEAR
jgi:hypothetical protein